MAGIPDLPAPERPRGTPEEQVSKLYRYLWELVEQLNNVLRILEKRGDKNDTAL